MKYKPGTFEYIEAKIRADAKGTEFGLDFEKLCKHYLENAPLFKNQLKKVWLWKEWPDRWKQQENGIDLVAITHDGEYWAIQAKCFNPANRLIKEEIDSFISESGRRKFSYRLLIATTNKINGNARDILEGLGELAQAVPVGTHLRDDIITAEITWPADINKTLIPLKPFKPQPHHTIAINQVVKKFKKSSKGQLIMACGTGKTFTSIKIAERINGKRILVLVPSLNLVAQTIKEWGRNHKKQFSMCVVCSDETVVRGKDVAVQTTAELGVPVNPTNRQIKTFLKKKGAKPKVIFCTYQSADKIESVQKKDCPAFDLVIADEAHRCAGLSDGGFGVVVKDNAIKSKKKLFMTATPRIIGERVRQSAEDMGQEIISMCDKSKFGDVFHRLDFSEAIEKKILSDYQVVIIGVSEGTPKQFAVEGRIVKVGKNLKTDARTLASSIGLAKAIQKYKLQKIITFHSSVAKAKSFGDPDKEGSLSSVVEQLPKDIKGKKDFWTRTIYGEMSVGKRQDFLAELRTMGKKSIGVIANCSCLGEGVDVPALDGVAFIDPKRSQIDIIQAVGRVIRKSENKKIGTIVLPVFIDDNEDPDEILKSSVFEPVWAVIKALKSHDDILSNKLDEFRISLPQEKTRIRLPSKIKLHIPKKIHFPSFQKAFSVRTVKVSTTTWDAMIKLIKEYKNKYGHLDPPKKLQKRWVGLFEWMHEIRLKKRGNILTPERVLELDDLGFDWNFSGVTLNDTKGLLSEGQFIGKFGFTSLSSYRLKGLITPIGTGIGHRGINYFYKPSQVEELRKNLGITLKNTKGLLNERQFSEKSGLTNINRYRKQGLLEPVGRAISGGAIGYFYRPSQINEIRKQLGITVKTTKGLLSEERFADKSGLASIQRYRKQGKIKPVGYALYKGAFSHFYHSRQIKELKKELGITLSDIKGLLSEQEIAERFGVSDATFRGYRKKELIKPAGQAIYNTVLSHFYKPKQIEQLKKKLGLTLTKNNTKGLLSETKFMEISGFSRTVNYRKQGLIEPIGTYVISGKQGIGYFYHPRQIKELKKNLGITLLDTKGLLSEKQIANKVGFARVKTYREQGKIKPAGFAMSGRHVSAYYEPKEIKTLRKELGITLSDTKGFLSEKQFSKNLGISLAKIQKLRKEDMIKPLGKAFMGGPILSFCYHPKQAKEIKKILKKTQ